jgi:hypothetical protein
MGGKAKLPFQSTTTNTFDFKSPDQNDPNVKDYLGVDIGVDPGVGRRTALNDQAASNRWNSSFMAGVPAELRMRMQGAERREIGAQGAAEGQQAEYDQNMLELARRERLLPQLIQTGGTSQGYQTQAGAGLSGILGGLGGAAGGAATVGLAL